MDREHQLEALSRLAGLARHQPGVQHRDVDAGRGGAQFVAQPMDTCQIGQIHLEHLHRAGAGAALHVLARFGMAATAGHQHAAAARRQIDGDGLSEPAVGAGHQADLAVDAPALGHRLDGQAVSVARWPMAARRAPMMLFMGTTRSECGSAPDRRRSHPLFRRR